MALDFSIGGYENLFRKALAEGINLFCGAGFSVEAYNTHGEKLMLGNTMLDRLKEEFPSIKSYTTLSRASTTLMRTEKEAFFQRIREWFTVGKIAPGYLSLLKIKLGNIYTTNIDDLFFRIFEASDNLYLIDRSINGAPYQDNYAVNYFPLHGCVNHEHPKYIFGVNDIASAFSQTDSKQSWESLAEDAAKNAILFWGWNFNDSDVIEAIYTYDGKKGETKRHQIKYPCRLRIVETDLIQLTDADREYLSAPLNLFDRLVFTALVSARVEGVTEISISALYRIITGKASNNCKPTKNHAAEILKSVKKLACLQVELDMSDAFQNYRERNGSPKYNAGKPLFIDFTPIIPCKILDGVFQGNSATVIQLTATSPLYKTAYLTKQILTVPREALNIGIMRNTSAVAYGVKLYTLIRVLEIRGSGYLKESVTFADIFY